MIIPHLTQYDSPHLSKMNTGLGNALFQLFTAYGLSRKYGHDYNFINLLKLLVKLKQFDLNHSDTIYRNLKFFSKLPENIKVFNEQGYLHSAYDENLVHNIVKSNENSNIYICGYLQSHLYFNDYYNDICDLISPDDKSMMIIKSKYQHLFDSDTLNISVHYRVHWGCGITFDSDFTFFKDSIRYLMSNIEFNRYKNVYINIFSDYIAGIKEGIISALDIDIEVKYIFFENNEDYIDLWSMSLCHHNVLSNSTLSWWGAYINKNVDKIVIYPNDILRLLGGTVYGTIQVEQRKNQHYMPEWVAMETKNVIHQNK